MAMELSPNIGAGSKQFGTNCSAFMGISWFRKWQFWCKLNLLEFCVILVFCVHDFSGLKTGKKKEKKEKKKSMLHVEFLV